MVRVVLAEDQGMTRTAYSLLLRHLGFDVVGLAEDGRQAVHLIEKHKPDVAVLDVEMAGATGIDALRSLQERKNPTPVILVTTFDNNQRYTEGLRAGMRGWLLKGEEPSDLADAIAIVADGKSRLVPRIDDAPSEPLPPLVEDLTPAETMVLRLASRGSSNASIGRLLGKAEGTVKNQMSSICHKLGVGKRMEAVRVAAARGIL